MLKKWASRALVAILSMTLVGMILGMISLLAFTGWALTLPRDVENQIILNVSMSVTILTPAGTQDLNVNSGMVVAETVLVGQVPQTMLNAQIQ